MLETSYGNVYSDILGLIGNTPLLRLKRLEEYFGLNNYLYGKLEFYNPGGSVKDRIGLYMLSRALEDGLVVPGAVIIEPTSGNTGIGLAIVSRIYGFKNIFVMPTKMSMEKELILKAYGGYVVRTPTEVSPEHPLSYYSVSLAIRNYIWGLGRAVDDDELVDLVGYFQGLVDEGREKIIGRYMRLKVKPSRYAYIPNQYFNRFNPIAHYETTGREIWVQSDGMVDILFAGIGTGGTITGIGRYLKSRRDDILVVGIDPEGSVYHHIKDGLSLEDALKMVSTYKVEGIGEDILPDTYDPDIVDDIVVVDDQHSFSMARLVARLEGILVGGSSGSALYGAIKYLKDMGIENKYIVVILPDTGRNYLTKFYDDNWMLENGFSIDDEDVLGDLG
jgi:cystathionine beta-synthase